MSREMRDVIKGVVKDHRLVSFALVTLLKARRLPIPLQPAHAFKSFPQGLEEIPRYKTLDKA